MMMTHIVTRDDAEKPLTDSEFCGWLVKAEPGDALEYHRGYLARDITAHATHLSEHDRVELARLARRAWWAAERQLVHLVQRRRSTNLFTYLVIARPRPNTTLPSLSSLLAQVPGCEAAKSIARRRPNIL
jgi:hypothetical protein